MTKDFVALLMKLKKGKFTSKSKVLFLQLVALFVHRDCFAVSYGVGTRWHLCFGAQSVKKYIWKS